MTPKQAVFVSPKVRASARGESCVRCGCRDDTVVLAHYTGLRQHRYGKGRGRKGSDIVAAHLCLACHMHFDNPHTPKSIEASEEFLHCVALTLMRLVDGGVLR